MPEVKSWFVPGIIILGILLIVAALLAPNTSFEIFEKKPIATILDITGNASTQGLDQIDSLQLKIDSKIKNLDIIKTDESSEVLVSLTTSGGEFRLLENAEALIEETDAGATLVTLRQGEILVDEFGKKPSFWIRRDGRQLSAMDYALSNERNANQLKKQNKLISTNPIVLTQVKIEEILNSKKSDFTRCYGQLIQKTEQAHGQIIISFEISYIGKVIKAEVTNSEFEDDVFKSCIVEVVARTHFPRFAGKNITTVFPLKFK
jgi:hypothetical protein